MTSTSNTRFKPVPDAPDSLDGLAAVRRAVPLVPETEDDCCARLVRRCDLPDRDAARTWLTFLRALELAEETADGSYRRRRVDPDPAALRDAFRDRVFGARELLDALGSADAIDADAAFAALRERVPRWERHRSASWEDDWRDRTGRLLEWAALLGLAETRGGGYVAAPSDESAE